jgi:hypothetical protein
MKASDVIEQLEKLMKKYGDLDCRYDDGFLSVDQVIYLGEDDDYETESFLFC